MSEGPRPAGGPTVDELGAPTGERFSPELMGGGLLEAEHLLRYQFAAQLAAGRTTLDAGCGVGWGLRVLLDAGAPEVSGFDLSPEAVREARARLPAASISVGDICAMPPESGRYSLITCFEVLEHVAAQRLALDWLTDALAPDGVLLVSSPNPGVYPGGNPYHIRELPPEALLHEVSSRLEYTALWLQRAVVGSTMRTTRTRSGRRGLGPHEVITLPSVEDRLDQYSVVVAAHCPIPQLSAVSVLASSQQLDQLGELAEGLEADRQRVWEDHRRIVAEREKLLLEVDRLRAEVGRLGVLPSRVEQLIQERDRVSLMLLEAEQECASYLMSDPAVPLGEARLVDAAGDAH